LLPTTKLESLYATKVVDRTVGLHRVIEGAFSSLLGPSFPTAPPNHFADILFFDTPSVEPDETVEGYSTWLHSQFYALDRWCKPDAVLYLCPTDRKGHPWSKSAVTVNVAFAHGWKLFRHMIWQKQEADWSRSEYAFQDVWVLRRGNRPVRDDSPIRYKDVVKIVQRRDDDSHIGKLSPEMIRDMLTLFIRGDDLVMDPFAGRGSVMEACQELGLRSISVELHPERAHYLRDLAEKLLKEGVA
jgi:DNA modification methylase